MCVGSACTLCVDYRGSSTRRAWLRRALASPQPNMYAQIVARAGARISFHNGPHFGILGRGAERADFVKSIGQKGRAGWLVGQTALLITVLVSG